jgi:hypothetical protein
LEKTEAFLLYFEGYSTFEGTSLVV